MSMEEKEAKLKSLHSRIKKLRDILFAKCYAVPPGESLNGISKFPEWSEYAQLSKEYRQLYSEEVQKTVGAQ